MLKYPLLFYFMLLVEGSVTGWALFRWKNSTYGQKFIILLLTGIFIVEILELWMAAQNIRNFWLIDLATLGECLILLSIFRNWKTSVRDKKIILVSGIAFVIIWVVAKWTFEPFNQMNIYTSAVARIIEISFAISILFDVLKDSHSSLKGDIRLWVSSAVIIYATGSLLLFALFVVMLKESPSVVKAIWPVNWVLMIVYYLLYARSISCRVPQKK